MCEAEFHTYTACVRGVFLLGSRKLAHYNELPYLLARLREPQVAKRVRELWAARPQMEHHRVTRSFMNNVAEDLAAIHDDGSHISARLDIEIGAMAGTPMDDSIAEGPHAAVRRYCDHARHGSLEWIAATTRLTQNLQDLDLLPGATNLPLQHIWFHHKSLMQKPNSRRPHVNAKMNDRTFFSRVYKLSMLSGDMAAEDGPDEEEGSDNGDESGHDEGGCGGDGGGGGGGRDSDSSSSNDKDLGGGDGEGGDDGQGPPRSLVRSKTDTEVTLMRQWLAACLQLGGHYTFRCSQDAVADPRFVTFQLLALQTKPVLVKCYETEIAEPCLFNISIQPLEVWSREMYLPQMTREI